MAEEEVIKVRRAGKKAKAEQTRNMVFSEVGDPNGEDNPLADAMPSAGTGVWGEEEYEATVLAANKTLAEQGRAHYANLIPYLDERERAKIEQETFEDITAARQSRSQWEKQLAEGLERVAINPQLTARAEPFPGASSVVHPALAMAAVDFMSRASHELLPPNGPVKGQVVGKATAVKVARADRVSRFMNFQLTKQMPEYYPDSEQLLMMLPFEGTSFKKIWYDDVEKRPRSAYIPNTRMIVPYGAQDLATSPMYAEILHYHPNEVNELVRAGAWLKHMLGDAGVASEPTSLVQTQVDKTHGLSDPGYDPRNGILRYYEVALKRDIRWSNLDDEDDGGYGAFEDADSESDDLASPEGDPAAIAVAGIEGNVAAAKQPGAPPSNEQAGGQGDMAAMQRLIDQAVEVSTAGAPTPNDEGPREWLAVFTVDTQKLVSIRRNWSKEDPVKRRIEAIVAHKMFPWQGFWGIGLLHLIGRLSQSATGSLRALLDAAMLSTMPGGVVLKGTRATGQNVQFPPGTWTEIEAPFARDVRQILQPYPTNGPNSVLFDLLKYVVSEARDFVTVATRDITETSANMPVGTVLALIEEGSRVYSTIHTRLHRTQAQELKIIHRIDSMTLVDEVLQEIFGDGDVTAADFDSTVDVVPVSDPNIFSQVQRAAQGQVVIQLVKDARDAGVPVDARAAYMQAARRLNIEAPEEFFPPTPQPQSLDVLSEHVVLGKGGEIASRQDQDHMVHIHGHLGLLSIPGIAAGPVGLKLFTHVQEHMAMMARAPFVQAWEQIVQANPQLVQEEGETPPLPPQLENAASQIGQQILEGMLPTIQPLFMPQDSASMMARAEFAKSEAKIQEVQARTEADRMRVQFDAEKVRAQLAADIALDKAKMATESLMLDKKLEFEREKTQMELEAKIAAILAQIDAQRKQRQDAQAQRVQDHMMAQRQQDQQAAQADRQAQQQDRQAAHQEREAERAAHQADRDASMKERAQIDAATKPNGSGGAPPTKERP